MTTTPRAGLGELLGSWRIALRLVWRTSRRRPTRSVLVILMLIIPALAATVLIQSWAAINVSADQAASWRLGNADLLLQGDDQDALIALLPEDSRAVGNITGDTILHSGDNYKVIHYRAAAVGDPMLEGAYAVRTGEVPQGPAEVALTSQLAVSLGLQPGETLAAGMPPRQLTIVGIIDTLDSLGRHALIVPPEHPLSAQGRQGVFVSLPAQIPGWLPPHQDGAGYMIRSAFASTAAEQAVTAAAIAVVVGFAGAQVMLLVTAAFTVSARRQRRELALIAAAGANRRQLARVVLANGLVFGAIGGCLGVILGLIFSKMGRGVLERIVDKPLGAGAPIWQLVGIAIFAIVIGLLSAWGPARGVSRQPIRFSLTGREVSAARTGRRLFIAGLAAGGLGVAVAVWATRPAVGSAVAAAAGGGLILLGAAACAPTFVATLGKLLSRAAPAVRLAARHAARHQLRTGAAAAAVAAAMAGSIGLMLYYSADTATGLAAQPTAPEGQVLLAGHGASMLSQDDVSRLAAKLPTSEVVALQILAAPAAYAPGSFAPDQPPPQLSATVAVGGPELIRTVTGRTPTSNHIDALERGRAITFHPEFDQGGHVELAGPEPPIALPATLVEAPARYSNTTLPSLLISEETADRLSIASHAGGIVVDTRRSPTSAELTAAQSVVLEAQAHIGADGPATPVRLAVGQYLQPSSEAAPVTLVLALVSALVTLVASAVAVGLTTAEMRGELATLTAVGASPALRRWVAAAQAGMIVGIGGVLGVAGGITPAAGLVAMHADLTWQMPWGALVLVVVVAPLAAVVGTALFARQQPMMVRHPG